MIRSIIIIHHSCLTQQSRIVRFFTYTCFLSVVFSVLLCARAGGSMEGFLGREQRSCWTNRGTMELSLLERARVRLETFPCLWSEWPCWSSYVLSLAILHCAFTLTQLFIFFFFFYSVLLWCLAVIACKLRSCAVCYLVATQTRTPV